MASLASPSPSSLQLSFRLRCREYSSAALRIRFSPAARRRAHLSVVVSAAGASAERDGTKGQSWGPNNGSTEFFAGWSDSDGSGGDPGKKGRFGDMFGAGLAGVFFAAGVTFASLSMINRSTSGLKKQMEPLTTEQEVLLSSDDQNVKVGQLANESNEVLPDKQSLIDGCNLDCETGINKDLFLPKENSEDTAESRNDKKKESRNDNFHNSDTSLTQNIKPNDNGIDGTPSYSSEDLQIAPELAGIRPLSDSNPSPEFSAQVVVGFPSGSSSKDPSDTKFSGEPIVGHDINAGIVDHVDSSSLGIDSSEYATGYQEEKSRPTDFPLEFPSGLEGQLSSRPLPSSPIILESGDIVDSQVSTRMVVEAAASVSNEHDARNSETLQFPADDSTSNTALPDLVKTVSSDAISGIDFDQIEALAQPIKSISFSEGHGLHEKAPSVTYPVPIFADTNGIESDLSSQRQTGGGLTLESLFPESFSHSGIPAPSLVSAALQVSPGKVLVPAVVDQVQGQALAALQVLKVIEADVQPGDICSRREYARWLVSASSVLARNTTLKVYPAMYIENVTELAFDDITPDDPDYPYIQGLAEAGIIASKLTRSDLNGSSSVQQDPLFFSPESPVSRQDLVSWKMALEKRVLPQADRNYLSQYSGFIDADKVDPDACPALVGDLHARDQGIIALAFGFTRLFQPNKPVTKAQAAVALATGDAAEVVGEELTRIEAESLAETAVNAHTALVAQVEKDLNSGFEKELAKEREKLDALEKLAEEARQELERLKAEKEEENNALIRGRAAVESEMGILSRLRHEVEEQLQDLISNKMEISFERDKINKLRKEVENENQVIVQLQYELEVERKALTMARSWAEEEAKRAREQAKTLEAARERWERQGIKVIVDEDLQDDASTGITWVTAGKQAQVDETVERAENLLDKLKTMAGEMKVKSSNVIDKIIQKITSLISTLKQWASEASEHAMGSYNKIVSKASRSLEEFKDNASGFSSSIGDRARRTVEDCKDNVEKLTQKFKT